MIQVRQAHFWSLGFMALQVLGIMNFTPSISYISCQYYMHIDVVIILFDQLAKVEAILRPMRQCLMAIIMLLRFIIIANLVIITTRTNLVVSGNAFIMEDQTY